MPQKGGSVLFNIFHKDLDGKGGEHEQNEEGQSKGHCSYLESKREKHSNTYSISTAISVGMK
jgi:hypothetical protein